MPPQSSERTWPKKRHRGDNDFQEISTFQTEHPIEDSSNRQDLPVEHHFETDEKAASPFQPVSTEPSHDQRGVRSPPLCVARSFMGAYVREAAAFLDVLAADITDHVVKRAPPAIRHILNECCDEDPSFHLPHAEQPCEDSWLETDAESWCWVDPERPDAEQPCEDTWREADADRFRFGDSAQTINDQYGLRSPPDYHDTRFHHKKQEKWYCCDGCSKNVFYSGQSFPHDGYWLESKRGLCVSTFHARWLAGENFKWYCTQCHAVRLGYGTGNRADDFARIELGLVFHAMNRRKSFIRFTNWR